MSALERSSADVHTYCTLCGVGCPVVLSRDGDRVVKLDADHGHPDGGAVCGKGRAAPEIHDHANRLNYPLVRTNPKTSTDPGWRRVSWDGALDLISERLLRIRRESGPAAVAFGRGTGSGTGLQPVEPWLRRFANVFGSPNFMTNTHVCNWARDGASYHTFGVYPLPTPDVERSGCIVLWGANPTATVLDLGRRILAARKRGARLLVIDPRRVGLGTRADVLLQVRPGTDGALALAMIHEVIENGTYDQSFVKRWTNAPFLVRMDTGRLARAADFAGFAPNDDSFLVLTKGDRVVPVDIRPPADIVQSRGDVKVELRTGGTIRCVTVLQLLAEASIPPEEAEVITGVDAEQIRYSTRLLIEHRPVSYHIWNGVVQHTNSTQAGRAIQVLFALIGDWDRFGGNLISAQPLTRPIVKGTELPDEVGRRRLGREQRPLGPAAVPPHEIAAYDLFEAILRRSPYEVRALLSFGGNTIMNSANPIRSRQALQSLEFFAQMEVFHTPTTSFADVLLPATTFIENDVLMITRSGVAQRRIPASPPLYERRGDVEVIFQLAQRIGLNDELFGGGSTWAFDQILAPAGLTWDGLLEYPHGVRVAAEAVPAKYRETGFTTPTGRVEIWSEPFAEAGYAAVPCYEEPVHSPSHDIANEFPLVMTNAKLPQYLHSQHRGVAAIRKTHPDPTIEIHPETASRYNVVDNDSVVVETQYGRIRARADVTDAIKRGTVCIYHGWWEGCEELGRPPLDPYTAEGSNANLLIGTDLGDPISGAIPHRSTLCRILPITPGAPWSRPGPS